MCATCGCGDVEHEHQHEHEHHHHHHEHHAHDHAHHDHEHHHDHQHHHEPGRDAGRTVRLEAQLLAKNDARAALNRRWLADHAVAGINLMSSPGAGKTTLLERTLRDLGGRHAMSVVEGDQETARDAERIRAAGAPAVQINTGAGCHLDAAMVARALDELAPVARSLLFIENVGNLVCPALFDLGERARVVVASVTEGDDKPLKYPHMFRRADVVVLNKIDLLPYVAFDEERFADDLARVNRAVTVLRVSATRGDGLGDWYDWLDSVVARAGA